jgi:hypothetical protein
VYWTKILLARLADLDLQQPRWGKRRVHAFTSAHGLPMSEPTVGRMHADIRRRCPLCGTTTGRHVELLHVTLGDWQRQTG